MKIYIAAPFAARDLVRAYSRRLAHLGYECTSTWALSTREIHAHTLGPSLETPDEDVVRHAQGDLDDIDRSDGVIMMTGNHVVSLGVNPTLRLHTGGRHVEVGYALAQKKPVIIVGEPENVFQRGMCRNARSVMDAIHMMEEDEDVRG